MPTLRSTRSAVLSLLFCGLSGLVSAQITVEGITDKKVYADTVSFRVPEVAGWTYTVELNGAPSQAGVMVPVDSPDYYQLAVHRKNNSTNAEETASYQFIVRSSERQDSEWGLPPWVPYPVIPSAEAEFSGAHLKLIVPASFPQGIDIPVVAWIEDASGKRVGVNGFIADPVDPDHGFVLRRGVGSGGLPAATNGGQIAYNPQIGGLSQAKAIDIDASTSWTTVTGTVSASADWGENARVHVTGDVTVPSGVTLTIGAGSVIRLDADADINVNGTVRVDGTIDRPVVFAPTSKSAAWGGFIFKGGAAHGEITGALMTGSGADPKWFDNNPGNGHSHRNEQPCIFLSTTSHVNLTDSALIDGKGQAAHGETGFFTVKRCLFQRFISFGQFNDGTLDMDGSAVMEFPYDGAPFADDDNDAIYLTGGSHSIRNSVVGWALDDGIDAGSGAAGPVTVTGCWIESCFHEGMAWSESRLPTVKDTVVLNCGQGIECGFGAPDVKATHIFSTGNLSGARFGDNYDWTYSGNLDVTGSLILYNYRDIFGRAWDNWTEHLSQMSLTGNFLTAADAEHPSNSVWNPAANASMLDPFLPSPATQVGVGLALREDTYDFAELAKGIPIRLSTFTTHEVSVGYSLDSEDGSLGDGTVTLVQGETVKRFTPDVPGLASHDVVRVTLTSATGGELTGRRQVTYLNLTPVTLIPKGAVWKYNDGGVSLGTTWRETGFVDDSWTSGPAELGFGDGDEATTVNIGPDGARFPAIYFRHAFSVADPSAFSALTIKLRRDDGAVVFLNGQEVFRSNMPAGTISFATLASSSSTSETTFFEQKIGPEDLAAGDNVVAVEVHQANATSGDLSFDLELVGTPAPVIGGGPTFVRGDANQDGEIDISDPLRVLFFLFAGTTVPCEDALDGDDNGTVSLTDAIYILRYLFQGGPQMPSPFPGRGSDPTDDAVGCAGG